MTRHRSLALVLAGATLTVLGPVGTSASTASTASPASTPAAYDAPAPMALLGIPPVYYHRGASIEPSRVHRTRTGPSGHAQGLEWTGWGTDRAVGRGVYLSDCRTCPAPTARGYATVLLRDLEPCVDAGTERYSSAVMVVESARDGSTARYRLPAGGCP